MKLMWDTVCPRNKPQENKNFPRSARIPKISGTLFCVSSKTQLPDMLESVEDAAMRARQQQQQQQLNQKHTEGKADGSGGGGAGGGAGGSWLRGAPDGNGGAGSPGSRRGQNVERPGSAPSARFESEKKIAAPCVTLRNILLTSNHPVLPV